MPTEKLDLAAQPQPVLQLAAQLRGAGGRAWLVGGSVRDQLLGLPVTDHDLTTDLSPDRLLALLPDADARDAGLGAVRVQRDGVAMVLTTLRQEGEYRDHRHPGRVEFVGDVDLDARRRDFTCNALYLDLEHGGLLDPVGGLDDLRRRRLRCIGDPTRRLREDALRLLRAVRFAARLQLEPDPELAVAMRDAAPLLLHLSPERCYAELTRAVTGPGRGRALRLLVDLGLAAVLLPEVAAMAGVPQPPEYHPEGDVLTHAVLVLDAVPAGSPELAWSALLHDIGKPPTFCRAADRIRFDGHDELSATMAEAVLQRLHAPAAVRDAVVAVCRSHIHIVSVPQMRPRRRERWLRDPRFPLHLAFHRADCLGSHGQLSLYETLAALHAALPPVRPVLLRGADVLALGVPSGPRVGELLAAVDAALEDHPAPDRDLALRLLAALAGGDVKAGPGVADKTPTDRSPAQVAPLRPGETGDGQRQQ